MNVIYEHNGIISSKSFPVGISFPTLVQSWICPRIEITSNGLHGLHILLYPQILPPAWNKHALYSGASKFNWEKSNLTRSSTWKSDFSNTSELQQLFFELIFYMSFVCDNTFYTLVEQKCYQWIKSEQKPFFNVRRLILLSKSCKKTAVISQHQHRYLKYVKILFKYALVTPTVENDNFYVCVVHRKQIG